MTGRFYNAIGINYRIDEKHKNLRFLIFYTAVEQYCDDMPRKAHQKALIAFL